MAYTTVIIGAGMAGLSCAKYLHDKGIYATILEASDAVGGRVRTDVVDGFTLDRGFQILLTAYPEAQKLLDYQELNLKTFRSGVLIRQGARSIKMADPFKEASAVMSTLFSPVGSLADKLRVLRLAMSVSDQPDEEFFKNNSSDTLSFLKEYGWSNRMIENFFTPFFGGVFLENELATSSSFFEFVFKQFYAGEAAIPAKGIQQIPNQVLSKIPRAQLRLHTKVTQLSDNKVTLATGEVMYADAIVLATDAHQAALLLGKTPQRTFTTTTCTYFAADRSPLSDNMLVVNTNRQSAVHNLCVPSDIAPDYAPAGKALISVSTQGLRHYDEAELTAQIKKELVEWYGSEVNQWQHLRTYHIPEALPAFLPNAAMAPLQLSKTLYQCGDQTAYPSLNAAIMTGRQVAEMILGEV
ncbi:MAG: NAD(P)/FAD-dependent oxidoreductase [Spirosomataceae bacterium]